MNSNFIPDGEWQGFYFYSFDKSEHKMNCTLRFLNGLIQGIGIDDINPFSFNGKYTESLNIELIKSYSSHEVIYTGCADENGIWGKWKLYDGTNGGFHIWPTKENSDSLENEDKLKKATPDAATTLKVKELALIT